MSTGTLRVEVYIAREALPLPGALVEIYNVNEWQSGSPPIARLIVDESGQTEAVTLNAPDAELSQSPCEGVIPYSTYDVIVQMSGYQSQLILGVQIFAGVEALQQVEMVPTQERQPQVLVSQIPVHNLAGPPQPNLTEYSTARILARVVIPQYVTVHLGRPNASAANVTVSFRNYIKNVASSEIYPTWPENALRANIYCQISLTLNRIFTEWYRSRGYDFDITSSTSYHQAFINNRDIFTNISKIVDEIFDTYIQKSNFTEPFYAEYCDGRQVTCPGLKQWGTVTLANQGYTPLGILQYYYGYDISLVQAPEISGTPQSYPGTPLRLGSFGSAVRVMQQQLNRIRKNYPAIPQLTVDGQFGSATESAVRAFQRIFNLTQDGIVGKATWYKISYIYVAVTKLAEISSEGSMLTPVAGEYPGYPLRIGSTGEAVEQLQVWLRAAGRFYESIPLISAVDGIFGTATENAVRAFQRTFNLTEDGIVGPATWRQLQSVYNNLEGDINAGASGPPVYPGELLRVGSRGENVRIMQNYLNAIGRVYTSIPALVADGIYGNATANAVRTFQRLFGLTVDGIIGRITWNRIVTVYNSL